MTPRPKDSDANIIEAAAKLLAQKVFEWCDRDTELDTIARDLAKAMRWNSDGYELAQELQRMGYTPDAALVEILDDALFLKRKALGPVLNEWVASSGLTPPEIGSQVRHPRKPDAGIGFVMINYPDGTSTVRFPDAGHVLPGVNGTQGYVLPWEDMAPAISTDLSGQRTPATENGQ